MTLDLEGCTVIPILPMTSFVITPEKQLHLVTQRFHMVGTRVNLGPANKENIKRIMDALETVKEMS